MLGRRTHDYSVIVCTPARNEPNVYEIDTGYEPFPERVDAMEFFDIADQYVSPDKEIVVIRNHDRTIECTRAYGIMGLRFGRLHFLCHNRVYLDIARW